MEHRRVAMNFAEWLTDLGYLSVPEANDIIDEMIEDFEVLERVVPRFFYLLRDISDR